MPYIDFQQTAFAALPDHATLNAVFDVARSENEKAIGPDAHGTRRPTFEKLFNSWMTALQIIARLPDLEAEKITRTLVIAMVEGATQIASYDNDAPLQALDQMKNATALSPQASFYEAAIQEAAADRKTSNYLYPSVAQTEYNLIGVWQMIGTSRYLAERAEARQQMPVQNTHPREAQNQQGVITAFKGLPQSDIPASLYDMARQSVERLENAVAALKPAAP